MATNQFSLHTGNDLELLAGNLAELMRQPLSDPFGPELIVVQNRGMAVYLEQFLAGKLGIAANLRTVFLKNQVEELLALALGTDMAGELAFFSPETMRFAICRILKSESDEPAFEEYRRYLAPGHGDERVGQLAATLAALFD
ncbi:MAG: exodeoxyribonuclease V subunit gamma, partial [Victivallaceae bacterium]